MARGAWERSGSAVKDARCPLDLRACCPAAVGGTPTAAAAIVIRGLEGRCLLLLFLRLAVRGGKDTMRISWCEHEAGCGVRAVHQTAPIMGVAQISGVGSVHCERLGQVTRGKSADCTFFDAAGDDSRHASLATAPRASDDPAVPPASGSAAFISLETPHSGLCVPHALNLGVGRL